MQTETLPRCSESGQKVAYRKREAETVINSRMKRQTGPRRTKRPAGLRLYQCEFCGLWHLTASIRRGHKRAPFSRTAKQGRHAQIFG